jgi:hypothetical protein
MKLFIIKDILTATHSGMVIIAANNKDECREIFLKEFDGNDFYEEEFDNADFQVIESVGIDEPCLVSHMYGAD